MHIQKLNNQASFTAKYHPDTLALINRHDTAARFKLNEVRSSGDVNTVIRLLETNGAGENKNVIFEVTNENFPSVQIQKTVKAHAESPLAIDKKGIEYAEMRMLEKACKLKQYAKVCLQKLKMQMTPSSYKHWLEIAKKLK